MNILVISRRTLLVALLVLLVPVVLLANAGVGFLYGSVLHILFLNPVIGWLETFFIRRVFKVPARYGIIILANYVSSIVGVLLGIGYAEGTGGLFLFLLLVVSILVEWPMFKVSARKQDPPAPKVTLAQTAAANCVSYLLLLGLYLFTFDSGRIPPEVMVEYDIQEMAGDAYQYRRLARNEGGGGGSYERFKVPEMRGGFLVSATVARDSIVFLMLDASTKHTLVSAVLDASGNLASMQWFLSQEEDSLKRQVTYWLRYVADEAHAYRLRPYYTSHGPGTFLGFRIPPRFGKRDYARFSAIVATDSVIFTAVPFDTTLSVRRGVVDSAGVLRMLDK